MEVRRFADNEAALSQTALRVMDVCQKTMFLWFGEMQHHAWLSVCTHICPCTTLEEQRFKHVPQKESRNNNNKTSWCVKDQDKIEQALIFSMMMDSYLDPVWRSRRKSATLLDVDALAMLLQRVLQFFGEGFKVGHRCWYFTSEYSCFVFINVMGWKKTDLEVTLTAGMDVMTVAVLKVHQHGKVQWSACCSQTLQIHN